MVGSYDDDRMKLFANSSTYRSSKKKLDVHGANNLKVSKVTPSASFTQSKDLMRTSVVVVYLFYREAPLLNRKRQEPGIW